MQTKKLILILIMSVYYFQNNFMNAQTYEINLQKYWHYRYRLVNDYMVVGLGTGESLPAFARNLWDGDILIWGETPRYMGWYLGVLATEYKLLKNNGQPLNQTMWEMFCALKAIERIDLKAETGWGQDPSLDGFLIQDDVPADFIAQHYQELNNPNHVANYTWPLPNVTIGSGQSATVINVKSGGADGELKDITSLDMYAELLVGYALVKKCVDDGIKTFSDPSSGVSYSVNLRQHAIDEADRIVSFLNTNHGDHWIIHDPTGSQVNNAGGGDARGLSHGFAKSGEYITGTDYTGHGSESFPWITAWQNAQDHAFPRCTYNVHIFLDLASVCDCWAGPFLQGNPNTTKDGIAFQGDYDAGGPLCPNGPYSANHYGWNQFYGAIHRFLHDYETVLIPSLDLCTVSAILNSAPYDGPFFHNYLPYYGFYDLGEDGWRSTIRFSIEPPSQTDGEDGVRGNYNGIDYMLMHNLYYLLNSRQTAIQGTYPYAINSTPYNENDVAGRTGNPAIISHTAKHININNLNVTTVPIFQSICQCQQSFTGKLIVHEGSLGVKITNTTVNNGGILRIIPHKTCQQSPDTYIFLPSAYMRADGNSNNNILAPYIMSDEFKQIAAPSVLISPNPTSGSFTISLKETTQVEVFIYNTLGECIYKSQILNSKSLIDISSRPRGIYLIKVQSADGKIYTEKIILQ